MGERERDRERQRDRERKSERDRKREVYAAYFNICQTVYALKHSNFYRYSQAESARRRNPKKRVKTRDGAHASQNLSWSK